MGLLKISEAITETWASLERLSQSTVAGEYRSVDPVVIDLVVIELLKIPEAITETWANLERLSQSSIAGEYRSVDPVVIDLVVIDLVVIELLKKAE